MAARISVKVETIDANFCVNYAVTLYRVSSSGLCYKTFFQAPKIRIWSNDFFRIRDVSFREVTAPLGRSLAQKFEPFFGNLLLPHFVKHFFSKVKTRKSKLECSPSTFFSDSNKARSLTSVGHVE